MKENGISIHPLSVRLPMPLQRKVRLEAKAEGLPVASVIRRIILRHYAAMKGAA